MLGGARQRLKLLRLVYAAEGTVAAFDRSDLAARTETGRSAVHDLREALHVLQYEVPELQLTPSQRQLLRTVAAMCPDPACSGECSRGWMRFLSGPNRNITRKLASAGLVRVAEGPQMGAHVTPLGRMFATAAARGEHGDRRHADRRAASWR
jgi:hypothetical protein